MAESKDKKRRVQAKKKKAEKNSASLSDKAYQHIKRMLLVNQLVAGQKIRYRDIAKKLSVSQTPVILALTRLENEGLVRSEANKGFRVPELDLEEARELYQLRALLETWLVKDIAKNITDDQLEKLEVLAVEHRSIRGEIYSRERLWADARFHLALASFSEHRIGYKMLREMFDRLYLRYRPERLSTVRMNETQKEHKDLLEALKKRDSRKAASIIEDHINRGQVRMLAGIKEEMEMRDTLDPWDIS
jgi:DNA-binding GntR family transcriptional regulator